MKRFDPTRYCSTMPDRQLLRLLRSTSLEPSHAEAIRQFISEREQSKIEEQRAIREIERERGHNGKRVLGAGIFPRLTRLTAKRGKLLQGGKVNPK